eukprot:Protomagalhaensia_wolfi_Nauph_80__5625@NODE_645_length_2167_cov_87_078477_g482_i0_p1_GENE_NODE_645_length_2167_cov_87_078477_g482_i0NODE_645_length_2167_cov_87_078477_g482_i0_p1_ORF_typecomplete_len384_score33_97RecR/PF02132_15/3_4e03RecR/PF02132_15/0_021_NODE_645_length_2167_cov_87_078477_g482_i02091360
MKRLLTPPTQAVALEGRSTLSNHNTSGSNNCTGCGGTSGVASPVPSTCSGCNTLPNGIQTNGSLTQSAGSVFLEAPRKKIRLSRVNSEGRVDWVFDIHVPVGGTITCVPGGGGNLKIEELVVGGAESSVFSAAGFAPRRSPSISSSLDDVPDNASVTPSTEVLQSLTAPSEQPSLIVLSGPQSVVKPSPAKFLVKAQGQRFSGHSNGHNANGGIAVNSHGGQGLTNSQGGSHGTTETAPKSRVHFTANGSIPLCRMPNCGRAMYFYKNENRWRCNLNRGGCGAVFYNVNQNVGPCSKCQRPLEDAEPCYDWCVCRYCTSAKRQPKQEPLDIAAPLTSATLNGFRSESYKLATPPTDFMKEPPRSEFQQDDEETEEQESSRSEL